MQIDYERFVRVCSRCVEVAGDPKLPAVIGAVYKATAEAHILAFLDASKAAEIAATDFTRENQEATQALNALDGPYRVARSTVVAVMPETVLPDTLKKQPTDTDKLNAIERLADLVDEHAGQPWADALLQSEFGKQAPATTKEVTEAIAANKVLSRARMARAAAYGPAYEVYLPFKRVVRDALGPASKEYRRIHLRASPTSADSGAEGEAPPEQAAAAEVDQDAKAKPIMP